MNKNVLSSGFSEVYKLVNLVLTVDHSFSALRRINTYRRSTQTQDKLSDLRFLLIEKVLASLKYKQTQSFYNNVIEKFVMQERKVELMFK